MYSILNRYAIMNYCFLFLKINIANDDQVKRVNKAFLDIQKELAHFSQGLSLEPLQKQLVSRNHFFLLWLMN